MGDFSHIHTGDLIFSARDFRLDCPPISISVERSQRAPPSLGVCKHLFHSFPRIPYTWQLQAPPWVRAWQGGNDPRLPVLRPDPTASLPAVCQAARKPPRDMVMWDLPEVALCFPAGLPQCNLKGPSVVDLLRDDGQWLPKSHR